MFATGYLSETNIVAASILKKDSIRGLAIGTGRQMME